MSQAQVNHGGFALSCIHVLFHNRQMRSMCIFTQDMFCYRSIGLCDSTYNTLRRLQILSGVGASGARGGARQC